MKDIYGKKILIVGLGRSGIAAARALIEMGAAVSVQDSKEESKIEPQLVQYLKDNRAQCYFGCIPEDVTAFDMVLLSPGVSPETPFVEEAKNAGVEITGELEMAYRLGKGKYVAITGTNGKTTTTTLVGEIFKNDHRKTHVVGNIGSAVIAAATKTDDDAWLVTEVSSFQLETTKEFKPVVSAILNLTEDHMNRHHTMEEYGRVKALISANQTPSEYLVVNYDDKACYMLSMDSHAKIVPFSRIDELPFGAFVKDDAIVIADEGNGIVEICKLSDIKIPGSHNVENVLAAAAISYYAGIKPEVIRETISTFMGVEHRIEYVDTINGVKYYNDSKGTNPDSSIKAVQAIDGNIILIAGGYDKGSDFKELIKAFDGKVKKMMLLGVTAEKIKAQAEELGFTDNVMCADMEECVNKAFEIAEAGDTVLLSPACASWDMYSCFEQRGEHFKTCVANLKK